VSPSSIVWTRQIPCAYAPGMYWPPGYVARPARHEDVVQIAGLFAAADRAEGAPPWATPEDIAEDFRRPRMDLAANVRCVQKGAETVAYAEVWARNDENSEIDLFCLVHPNHVGRGLGRACLNFCEERAREISAGAALFNYTSRADDMGRDLLERTGYEHVRSFWHMEIDLSQAPPLRDPPVGLAIRALDPSRDARALHSVMEESFSEHWGWSPTSFEDWWGPYESRADFDPDLTLVAHQGEHMVGACINGVAPDRGWVRDLGVRKPWRGRGIAQVLLLMTFRLFLERGFAKVALGVDSENTTNATGLYERVGMRVYREFLAYRKELG
jgi:mycothiol synthase